MDESGFDRRGTMAALQKRETGLVAAHQVGEVAHIEQPVVRLEKKMPQNGAQFSDVTGPVISAEPVEQRLRAANSLKGRGVAQKGFSDGANVFETLAQGRYTHPQQHSCKIGTKWERRMSWGGAGHQQLNRLGGRAEQ